MNRILIVDDDDLVRHAISENLKESGLVPIGASSGQEALDIFQKEKPVSVILDLKMPGMDGMTVLKELKKIDPAVPVIINTAHGDIPTAVEAIKLGAYDFITKPPDFDRLLLTLKRAAEKYDLDRKVKILDNEIETSLEYLLGSSRAMKHVIDQIKQVAYSNFSLILQGDTGTGKSFIARLIHSLSKRAKCPFIQVDIGALPETLVESELFGYQKGAFTGADKSKKGYFEMADRGTLLIDELQNLSPYVQSKLLKAVEEKSVYPLGSTTPVRTDVRIIGATNKDIRKSAGQQTSFREDLFFRLSEFMITIPPLRERPEDIPFYIDKFSREVSEELDKQMHSVSPEAMEILTGHTWPGNIRELKNVIRRAVLLSPRDVIEPGHIQFLSGDKTVPVGTSTEHLFEHLTDFSLLEVEKAAIRKVLQMTGGNKSKAAVVLKIDYTSLLRKTKKYGI